MKVNKNYRKLSVVLTTLALLLPANLYAKKLVSIKIKPEDVGVFYENRTQQFQAIAVFDDGSTADYTTQVGWSLSTNSFVNQTHTPEDVATINANTGLATIKSSWGRVNVVATYPKPEIPSVSLEGVYGLLLKQKWVDTKEPPSFLPSIYLLLLKK